MALGANGRTGLLAFGLQLGMAVLAVLVKGQLQGYGFPLIGGLVAFTALLDLIALLPGILAILVNMVALGAGDFVGLGVFLVGHLHGGLGPFAVLEQGLVVVDFKAIRHFLVGRVNPGHEPQRKDKGDDKKDKQDGKNDNGKQDKDSDQKGQPKPQPGNSPSKQRMENLLDAVNNEEKKIQDKVNARKVKGRPIQTEKDW
jgi:hypothetical protein